MEKRKLTTPEEIEQLTDEELLDLWEDCAWRRDAQDQWTVGWFEHEWWIRHQGDQHDRVDTIRKIWER